MIRFGFTVISNIDSFAHRRIRGLFNLISNTPLLAAQFLFRGQKRTIYVKSEDLNMKGSLPCTPYQAPGGSGIQTGVLHMLQPR
jgi:hypothetical protein